MLPEHSHNIDRSQYGHNVVQLNLEEDEEDKFDFYHHTLH